MKINNLINVKSVYIYFINFIFKLIIFLFNKVNSTAKVVIINTNRLIEKKLSLIDILLKNKVPSTKDTFNYAKLNDNNKSLNTNVKLNIYECSQVLIIFCNF
jgi:hypothetical protein